MADPAIGIRLARDNDIAALRSIERSAGAAFRRIADLAWLADGEVQSAERHRTLITQGTNWVATDAYDRPLGFLSAEVIVSELHILELSVALERQGRGIGKALVLAAIGAARARGLAAVTLTTFRDVPWNAPFYRRLGFEVLDAPCPRLAAILREEAEHGLAADRRCAMRYRLS